MANRFKNTPAHSAEYFGDTRDHWWNLDFLRLMAKRWELGSVRDALDVGCGVGHWGTVLAAVTVDEVRDHAARRIWIWDEHQTRRYFLAGGGVTQGFDALFTRALAARQRIVRDLDDGGYHGVLGGAFYLVGGRKPA